MRAYPRAKNGNGRRAERLTADAQPWPRVVVVGAGFGALALARELASKPGKLDSGQSSLTSEGKPAPLALDFLNASASEADSLLDDAKAVNSNKTEQATELHWAMSRALLNLRGRRLRVDRFYAASVSV